MISIRYEIARRLDRAPLTPLPQGDSKVVQGLLINV